MQIKNLKITGLYGYINKDIDFYSDMTLLVGINGSGKTSIMNILNWVLKPSLPNLCVTEFKKIELSLIFKGVTYDIICKHTESLFQYLIKSDKETFHPLSIRIVHDPSQIKNDEVMRGNLIENYTGLMPDPDEKKTWDLISTFPDPIIIGLDRNLLTEEKDHFYLEDGTKRRLISRNLISSMSPLDRVKDLVNTEFRKRKNSILNLTDDMKNHLMLSTFDGSITLESFSKGIKYKLNLARIQTAEQRVDEYFNKIEKKVLSETEKTTITTYFSQLKEITIQYQTNPEDESVRILYGLNASQFVKVNKLLKQFEKFERESKKALEQITIYLETLNYFLKDSAKQILFKEDTSELSFNTLDKSSKVITEYKDINFLSSGEQQILILFSYIAFNSQDGKVFIIDEPELSLHIKWQEDFLSKLENITPKSTQLILATHSPILANKKKNKAKILLPYND